MDEIEIETPHGQARAHLDVVPAAPGAVVLGHGAGGGVGAKDLLAAAAAARAQRFSVALVEQPYRVAGRRSPPRAPVLDASWEAVIAHLSHRELAGLPLVVGGRSSGARVACRTATAVGAIGVLCLAFPLLPPRRAGSAKTPESRLGELDAVTVPTLVIQGRGDRFGMPGPGPNRAVVEVAGDHSLRSDVVTISEAVGEWLAGLITGGR